MDIDFAIEVDNINNNKTQQEIANTIMNHAQTYSSTQSLYILEENKEYRKFTLPLQTYREWIKQEELTKQINFIKPHGSYNNEYKGVWTEHYVCSRSGTKQVRNDRIQGGNSQKIRQVQKESKKVGCLCEIRIYYKPSIFSYDIVIVHYQYNHNGHIPGSRADVQYLKKSEETIAEIKKFARQGLSHSAIRQLMKAPEETIERYFTSKDIVPNRDDLLTYEDIYNVIYKEIHSKYRYHDNDTISVLHWAKILQKNRENINNLNDPILSCFQMHNEKQKFLLGFHTPWQYKMYQKYHELIHIDSTHNTNSKKYFLFTILIRHPHSGHGVPLAWLISESCNSQTIETWLFMLKNDGWAKPTAVMLDNDDAEINAICSVFPQSKIFLCWWHLKRAWRLWISKKIKAESHDSLFNDMDQLLSIDNENKVDVSISQFEKWWQNTLVVQYFAAEYIKKKEMWIKCYRHNYVHGINTNNYIESYHRKIKHVYLLVHINRRIDFLVNELAVNILKDYHEEITRYELNIGRMGSHRRTWRKFEINSANIDNDSIFRLHESMFIIKSTQSECDYIVERYDDDFVCNCEAYLKNPTPCKHIFAISRKYNIELLEQITYFPLDYEIQLDNVDNVDINQNELLENVNKSIDQHMERLISLYQKSNLDNIPLNEKKNIIKKLDEISTIFLFN
ncbi:hypothetical protein F8M41_016538 [Gigaspora margarita]|uniref:SWIM-type domain-containing protein n=1 Tax=Gigaspora margarita TaxID=4874 RepID=A0A8H4B321_GIGMA|nr:hypothetical protein F8M41_016538 [Gigaspora margarita]